MLEFRIFTEQPSGILVMGCKQYDLVVQGHSHSDLLSKMMHQFVYYEAAGNLNDVPPMPDDVWETFNAHAKKAID